MSNRSNEWHEQLRASVMNDPEGRAEYEAFSAQLDLADKMRKLRKKAGLTQDDIAEKMHTSKPAVARLEAAGGKGRHSPSIGTLARYASALGYRLEINLKRAT